MTTEKRMFVRYIGGKMPSVSHNGSLGESYFFGKNLWVPVASEDYANYERKATKNPHNWEVKYDDIVLYDDVHMIKFKGTAQYPKQITMLFDDEETGEKTREFIFKLDQWTAVNDDVIAKALSNKALANPNVWAYQVDKVPQIATVAAPAGGS